jgi:hypothetical protein
MSNENEVACSYQPTMPCFRRGSASVRGHLNRLHQFIVKLHVLEYPDKLYEADGMVEHIAILNELELAKVNFTPFVVETCHIALTCYDFEVFPQDC